LPFFETAAEQISPIWTYKPYHATQPSKRMRCNAWAALLLRADLRDNFFRRQSLNSKIVSATSAPSAYGAGVEYAGVVGGTPEIGRLENRGRPKSVYWSIRKFV
jgi:hypothetical protein